MLIEVVGDILLSKAQAIAHGVAPNDHMDRGLALALRERWPAMAKDFRHYCHVQHAQSGSAWTWKSSDGLFIISLLTQEAAATDNAHPGRAKSEHRQSRAASACPDRRQRKHPEPGSAAAGDGTWRHGLGQGAAAGPAAPRGSEHPGVPVHDLSSRSDGRRGPRRRQPCQTPAPVAIRANRALGLRLPHNLRAFLRPAQRSEGVFA